MKVYFQNIELKITYRTMSIMLLCIFVSGCATVEKSTNVSEAPYSQSEQRIAQTDVSIPDEKGLKHKIAIGRFTNETRYGKALLGGKIDPLGKQTSDMLARRLTESDRFLVLELPDIELIDIERSRAGIDSKMPNVDILIVGSLTEFGRNETGQRGFLSSTKMQTAYAKVDIRIVDVNTGHAFFAGSGTGEATLEEGDVMGFGSNASYDSTLNDKAIGAAIDDLMNDIVVRLEDRPWRTYVIQIEGDTVLVEGGPSQGLNIGDKLEVKKSGEILISQQTGFPIELPGETIAKLEITGHFNENTLSEGSTAIITEGNLNNISLDEVYVEDK